MAKKKYSFGANKSQKTIAPEGDKLTKEKFTTLEICLVLISLIAYLMDTLTDILVAMQYFRERQWMWGSLTVAFVLLPSVIIQIFSARWYAADGNMRGCRLWFVHIFQLQPLERYLNVIVSGIHARQTGDEDAISQYYFQQNDACMLRLFEAFLESAPQLTLQLYIMLCTQEAHWLTGTSACVSLLALGWAVAAYSHALRRAYRESYSAYWPGLALQTLWHISIAASRVLSLVAFASIFKGWLFVALGVHWTLMTIWVVLQDTDFCPSKIEEYFFDAVVGIIYCYCFFNLKEGQTRYRMAAYYTLMFIENSVLVALWYIYRQRDAWYNFALLAMVAGCFILGILCMILYYRFCHPSGPIFCCPSDDYPAYESKRHTGDDDEMAERYTYFESPRADIYIKNNLGDKKTSKVSMKSSKSGMLPRLTSTGHLPRRALLKQITQTDVEFKEVATPSQLSPIKRVCDVGRDVCDVYTDCTLELDESLQFQHYTVNASACLQLSSKCNTLRYSGMDMSRGNHLDSVSHHPGGNHPGGDNTGGELWKRQSREVALDNMRHIIQSTPLYAQHPQYRIHREKFTCPASTRRQRLKFTTKPQPDLGSPRPEQISDIEADENYSLLISNKRENSGPDKQTSDSGHGTDASSTGHGTDASSTGHGTDGSSTGHGTDVSSISDKQGSRSGSEKDVCGEPEHGNKSSDCLERETAILRDTNTL